MKKKIIYFLIFFLFAGVLLASLAFKNYRQASKDDDGYFESEILAFEKADRHGFPKPNGIVFVGSSSIRFWDTLAQDMSPLPVVRRGFGGAHMSHVLYNFDRIVTPYQPKAVVVFVGENDLHSGKGIDRIFSDYQKFIDKMALQLPQADLWIMSMKPSKSRWKLWGDMKKIDKAFQAFAAANEKINYIPSGNVLLNADKKPDDVYLFDGLHLNEEGYRRWASIVKPILLEQYN